MNKNITMENRKLVNIRNLSFIKIEQARLMRRDAVARDASCCHVVHVWSGRRLETDDSLAIFSATGETKKRGFG